MSHDKAKTLAVTPRQFYNRLVPYKDEDYTLTIKGWQVAVLHGLIALAADHPGIKKMHGPTQQVIKEVREWCKNKFRTWGFTQEEIEFLDRIREREASPMIREEASRRKK